MASAPSATELNVEREGNYAAVGAFVLLVIALASFFVYWYAGGRDRRDNVRYEIYFGGSVSGLNRGSAVRYLGVDVGRVADLRIDHRAPDRVQVIADIDESAPISDTTVAELSLQGVTGLLYIDLLADRGNKTLMEPVPSDVYPVIRSVRSNLDLFLASLPELVGRASSTIDRLNAIMSDKNIASITTTLTGLETTASALPETTHQLGALMTDLRATSAEIRAAAISVRTLGEDAGPDLAAAAERVRVVADNLANTTTKLDAMIAENRTDIRSLLRDGLPEFERLLSDSRKAANEFRELSQSLKNEPSQILFQPRSRGVEIPR
ncbi:MAG: MCE family protein [Pseudomonadales bacterium]|nr:MCE family protein [Pseudomonadales bacterium]